MKTHPVLTDFRWVYLFIPLCCVSDVWDGLVRTVQTLRMEEISVFSSVVQTFVQFDEFPSGFVTVVRCFPGVTSSDCDLKLIPAL